MRLKLISCQVFRHEVDAVAQQSPHQVEVEFLSRGAHEIGCVGLPSRIQQAIDRSQDSQFDVILLAYGFCNAGIVGLRARETPLVVPRAQDCVSVLMGRQKSEDYRESHPDAYFQSSGWVDDDRSLSFEEMGTPSNDRFDPWRDALADPEDDETEDCLHGGSGQGAGRHSQVTYISSGVKVDQRFAIQTAVRAALHGQDFEEVRGDLSMLQQLVNGDWIGDDFLIVPRGHRIAASEGLHIIQAVPDLG